MRSKPKHIKSPTQKEFPCYQAYIRQNEKTAPHISVPASIIKTNISILLNSYHGVIRHVQNGMVRFKARIHINGNYIIGSYSTSVKAAVAYNKAVDLAKRHGIAKNFPENYVEELSAKEYAELYTKIKISKKFLAYLDSMSSISD